MPDYLSYEGLSGLIPNGWLDAGLDDDANPDAEMFPVVAQLAEDEVNSVLAMRYPVPLAPDHPGVATVRTIALYIAASIVYGRRGQMERYPYADATDRYRKMLAEIGSGKLPLAPEVQRSSRGVEVISEPSRVASRRLNA